MSSLSIKVEVYAGSDIKEVAGEACVLANKLDCPVRFGFNGVHCTAYPGGSSDVLIENWEAALDEGRAYAMASTNRRAINASGAP